MQGNLLEQRHKLEQDQQLGQFAVGPVSCLVGSPTQMEIMRPRAFEGVEPVEEDKAGQGRSDSQGVKLTKTLTDKCLLLSFQPFWFQWFQETHTYTNLMSLNSKLTMLSGKYNIIIFFYSCESIALLFIKVEVVLLILILLDFENESTP